MIIYRPGDRIPVKFEKGITLWITPLTGSQFSDIQSETRYEGGKVVINSIGMAMKAIKYAVKAIEGIKIETLEGKSWELSFDANNNLTEESLGVLLQVIPQAGLVVLGSSLATNTLSELKTDGIKVDTKKAMPKKNKSETSRSLSAI